MKNVFKLTHRTSYFFLLTSYFLKLIHRTSSFFLHPSSFFKLIHRTSYFFLLTSYFLLSPASVLAATPLLCNPYTFVGRITDSRRTAFDDQRTATLSAYDTSNKLLARATTFYRDDSPNNYRLAIPMASSAADGCALQNDTLLITATDDLGRLWTAVIDPATVGAPGTISEVDIILSEDADGDGIDDTLYEELLAEYSASGLAAGGTPFDPRTDHDGDGITTLDEARLGTDPFNGDDTLRIESFDISSTPPTLTTTLPAGHVYTLESTPSLTTSWTPTAFTTDTGSSPRKSLSTPSTPDRLPVTLYLLPSTNPAPSFLRLSTR